VDGDAAGEPLELWMDTCDKGEVEVEEAYANERRKKDLDRE
jgi:hypothetical protein